ncbi:hypothetical protein STRCI_002962 [Streptomyces cinnabarinus]|uniref:ABC transporter permease n=1 Tax=Streptomyces cinnabarinus TaxID=67287 RepID=A0ABY7KB85_9ACTN|nr:hypothetical protein [Streptomyces cinnabarinus]WAZ21765.1 hypothetical protein STRCI_002962 [Streptomyces cinnabarinus]
MTLLTQRPERTEKPYRPTHPLRPDFVRGFAPLAGAAVLLTLLVALAEPAERWQGGWTETRDQVHAAATLLGIPLALAAGCWQGGRERRRRTGDLLETSVRGSLARFLAAALPVAVWVAVGHLVAAGSALVATWYCATGDGPYLLVPLVDTVVMGGAALAGQVVGRVLPWRPTPLLLAAAAYLTFSFLAYGAPDALGHLSPIADTSHGDEPVWWQPLAAAGWTIGLAAAAVLALAARRRATAVLPLAVATAAGVLLVQTGDGLHRADPDAGRQVCDTSTAPQICVNARHKNLLPQLTQALSGLTARLEGVQNLPVRFEDRPGRSRPDEVQLPMLTPFGSSVVRGELTDPEQYAWEAGMMLIGRAWCDRTDPVVDRTDRAVEHYLAPSPAEEHFDELDAKGSAADRAELKARQQARAKLLAMDDEERRTWLSEYFATTDRCDPKGVPTL